jgi:hypothetical protein
MELLGYKKKSTSTDNNVEFENRDSYIERMSGLIALYGALLQIDNFPSPHLKEYFGTSHVWTWIARILNLKPLDITPTILLTFLEITGFKLQNYGKQWSKIILFIREEVLKNIQILSQSDEDIKPAYIRLVSFVDKLVSSQGKVQPPKGYDL